MGEAFDRAVGGMPYASASPVQGSEKRNCNLHADTCRDGACGVKPLIGLLQEPYTPLQKKRRVLETLSFLANNPTIALSICDHGGIPPLLQAVTKANDDLQLEAAEALQALLLHDCAQV